MFSSRLTVGFGCNFVVFIADSSKVSLQSKRGLVVSGILEDLEILDADCLRLIGGIAQQCPVAVAPRLFT